MKRFEKAPDIVEKLLRRLGLSSKHFAVFEIWERLSAGSMGAMAIGLKHGRLVVEVESPTVHQELLLRKKELLKSVNGHFPKPVLSDIQFRLKSSEHSSGVKGRI